METIEHTSGINKTKPDIPYPVSTSIDDILSQKVLQPIIVNSNRNKLIIERNNFLCIVSEYPKAYIYFLRCGELQKALISQSVKNFENQFCLNDPNLLRIHKNTIINRVHIRSYKKKKVRTHSLEVFKAEVPNYTPPQIKDGGFKAMYHKMIPIVSTLYGIELAISRRNEAELHNALKNSGDSFANQYLYLTEEAKNHVIPINSINYIIANEGYSHVYGKEPQQQEYFYATELSLHYLNSRLGDSFFLINRNCLVNKQQIKQIETYSVNWNQLDDFKKMVENFWMPPYESLDVTKKYTFHVVRMIDDKLLSISRDSRKDFMNYYNSV